MGATGKDHDPVLDAVFSLVMRAGYGGFSMGDVAQTAGVPEREVTGRGDRAQLIVAALDRSVPPIPACPDTGSWRSDLLEVVRWQVEIFRRYGPVIERSLQATQESNEYAWAARTVSSRRLATYRPMFERAIARGDLDPDLDFESSTALVFGQVYARYLRGRPLEDEHAEAIVDLVVQGLTASTERS